MRQMLAPQPGMSLLLRLLQVAVAALWMFLLVGVPISPLRQFAQPGQY